jgi:hypothetical protein
MQQIHVVTAMSSEIFEKLVNKEMAKGWELSSSSVVPSIPQSSMSLLPQIRYCAVLIKKS